MIKQKHLAIGLILFVISSCNVKKSDTDGIKGILDFYNTPRSDHFVVLFIPAMGCNSCIRYSVEYAKNNINKSHLIVIVSAYQRKEISFLFDSNIRSMKNFVQDTLGLSHKEKIVSLTPKVFAIKDNEILFGAALSGNSTNDSDLLKLAESSIMSVTD